MKLTRFEYIENLFENENKRSRLIYYIHMLINYKILNTYIGTTLYNLYKYSIPLPI